LKEVSAFLDDLLTPSFFRHGVVSKEKETADNATTIVGLLASGLGAGCHVVSRRCDV
jgi:hypothetical protein